jgi:hypothetical protein
LVVARARDVLLSFELELEADWYECLGFDFEFEFDLLKMGFTG